MAAKTFGSDTKEEEEEEVHRCGLCVVCFDSLIICKISDAGCNVKLF